VSNLPIADQVNNRGDGSVEKIRSAWAWENGRLWVMDLSEYHPKNNLRNLKVAATFMEIHLDDLSTLPDASAGIEIKIIKRRLEAGKRCFSAQIDGRLASYCWVSRSAECIGEIEHEIHFEPDEAYIWDCMTLPEFRRRGLYTALLNHMAGEIRRDGVRWLWIGSSVNNYASMRGFLKAGYQPVADLVFMRIFNLAIMWVNGIPPASPFIINSARRTLTATWPHSIGPFVYDLSGKARLPAGPQRACEDQAI
jgi:ribosomal protein S18 acetylase RimI-like enzyme